MKTAKDNGEEVTSSSSAMQKQEESPAVAAVQTKTEKYPKVLTGKTPEELFAQFDDLKKSAKGANLYTGAVAKREDGLYIIKVDIFENN